MKLLIFTAPSGAGKTTIVKHLLRKYDNLAFSISATTRLPRPYEQHGKDYYFLTLAEWQQKIEENAFLEWEEVYENQFYGTLKSEIDRLWALGKHVIFDIEVKGATNIKKYYGDKAYAVFVQPPSPSVAARNDKVTAARYKLDDKLRKLKLMLETNQSAYLRAEQRENIYQQRLLADAGSNASAALNAYQSGVSDFTALMRAQITELDVRLDALRVRIDKAIAQARLLYLNGESS